MKTIKDLKEHLQEIIEDLDQYEENEELVIVENTYWLKNRSNFIAIDKGFIDLERPIDIEECEWCGDKFTKRELIKTSEFGCLCEQCFSYLESTGEKLTKERF